MSKPSQLKARIKLILATFILTVGSSSNFNFNSYSYSHLASANLKPTQTIQLSAKKSGGRSGGGSFKRKSPSSSKRRQPTRTKNKRQSSPSYKRERRTDLETEPLYRTRTRRDRTYYRSHSRGGRIAFPLVAFSIIFLIIGFIFIIVLFIVLKNVFSKGKTDKIAQERDNDRVTVSKLQVVLLAADSLQQDLSTLSTNTDTNTDSGLVSLMQETALILLRNKTAWTYVRFKSDSLNIDRAESVFNRFSITERSKFSGETLTNMNGSLQIQEIKKSSSDELAQYVVVTMLLGTADDKSLFNKINTETELEEQLLQFASMRDDYLFKFELLWTPQKSGEYLTDEELLLEYSNLIPLI